MNNSQGLKSLLAINVLAGCASGIMLLALPLYTLSLHASATEMGLISGMAGAGRMLIIVPSGVWADRYGTRRMFVISTLLCVALTAVIPWVHATAMLMGVMFFQGMAQSIGFMTLQAGFLKRMKYLEASRAGWQRSATQVDGDKGKIAALFSLSVAIGSTLGPIFGGITGETLGMQTSFLSPVALLLLIMIFQFWRHAVTYSLRKDSEELERVA